MPQRVDPATPLWRAALRGSPHRSRRTGFTASPEFAAHLQRVLVDLITVRISAAVDTMRTVRDAVDSELTSCINSSTAWRSWPG